MNVLKFSDALPVAIASGIVGMFVGMLLEQTRQGESCMILPRLMQLLLPGRGGAEKIKVSDNKYNDNNDIKKLHEEIETHLLKTQKPAVALGIRVQEVTSNSLTLSAPLHLNHNVHGTAFAGSLYSVAVLASYYLGRVLMVETCSRSDGQQQEDLSSPPSEEHQQQTKQEEDRGNNTEEKKYTLVAKSANIQYKRPVQQPFIIARSIKPNAQTLTEFRTRLEGTGKASMHVDGNIILDDGTIACDYSVEVCAYDPSRKKIKK